MLIGCGGLEAIGLLKSTCRVAGSVQVSGGADVHEIEARGKGHGFESMQNCLLIC